ncbi:hypothetical protein [Brevibacillus sp. SIMBA_040]|uniref:hypothetical protein n=1 Tax=unclassified Brevibacillus TaxID=2684853 RepID=UPI00397D0492
MKTTKANSSMEEQVHRQAEFPAKGTSLNPLDEEWVFSGTQLTSVDQPASTE